MAKPQDTGPRDATPRAERPRRRTGRQDEGGRLEPRLPHEHDESDDSQASPPRKIIEQAYDDVQAGREDTDLRATRGQRVPTVPKNEP